MKNKLNCVLRILILCGIGSLLASCTPFSAKMVSLQKRSGQASQDYYRFSAGGADELSFESRNDLSSNLLLSDFQFNGEQLVRRLAVRYEREPSRLLLSVLSDICFQLAQKTFSRDTALKYDLAAVSYAYELLFSEKYMSSKLGIYDPSVFQTARIYNGALARVYTELARRDLLRKGTYRLQAANGRDIIFELPHYDLIYQPNFYKDFLLCSDYRIQNLSHFTYEFGLGVPVIALTTEELKYKSLHTAAPIAHGATAFLRISPPAKNDPYRSFRARLEFYENERTRSIKIGNRQIPLIFDYSTPFAYYISSLPDMNLVDYMLHPGASDRFKPGLYTLEPYHEDKIPVVLVHGLLSSIHTWMQMVNTLKNDPLIRKHYQFWFYTYSSGNPILLSARELRESLKDARKELAKTKQIQDSFDHMVIIGHSMGGLVSKTLLQDPDDIIVRTATGRTWEEVKPLCTPEQQEVIKSLALYKSLPFVRRVLFLAVPHRGSKIAQFSAVRMMSKSIELPSSLLKRMNELGKTLFSDKVIAKKFERVLTGLDGLDPDDKYLQAMNKIPLRPDVPCHSIIGNNEKDSPGGSDGIVSYSSAHLDQVRSELVVKSGHSVQVHPVAIHEVRRILLEHLREEKIVP